MPRRCDIAPSIAPPNDELFDPWAEGCALCAALVRRPPGRTTVGGWLSTTPTVITRASCGRTSGGRSRTRRPTSCRTFAPDQRVLDVGSGPGTITSTSRSASRPGEVTGLDAAADVVAKAAALAAERGAGERPVRGGRRLRARRPQTARTTSCTRTRCCSTSVARRRAPRVPPRARARRHRRGARRRLRGRHLVPAACPGSTNGTRSTCRCTAGLGRARGRAPAEGMGARGGLRRGRGHRLALAVRDPRRRGTGGAGRGRIARCTRPSPSTPSRMA